MAAVVANAIHIALAVVMLHCFVGLVRVMFAVVVCCRAFCGYH